MSTMEQDFAAQRARWGGGEDEGTLAWDAARVARTWSKSRPRETEPFLREALARLPHVPGLLSAAAWNTYRADIGPLPDAAEMSTEQADRAMSALDDIRKWTVEDPYGEYSALPIAALQVAKRLDRWPDRRLRALALVDPDRLGDQRNGDFPSHRVQWYLQVTRALLDAERWSDLIAQCDRALTLPGLQPKERGWVAERRGRALLGLERFEEAVEALGEQVRRSADWWVRHALAQALLGIGDTVGAATQLRLALADGHDLSKRWRVIALLSQLLNEEDPDLAGHHAAFAQELREEQGWPADRDLATAIAALGTVGGADRRRLTEYWRGAEDPDATPRQEGVVSRVLDGGGSGFLTPDDGSEPLYFSMGRGKEAPPAGTRVSFTVVDSFDQKKQRASKRAVGLRVIQD